MALRIVAPGQVPEGIRYRMLWDQPTSEMSQNRIARAVPTARFEGFVNDPDSSGEHHLVITSPDWPKFLGRDDRTIILPIPEGDPWAWNNFSEHHPMRIDTPDFDQKLSAVTSEGTRNFLLLFKEKMLPYVASQKDNIVRIQNALADARSKRDFHISLLGPPSEWYENYSEHCLFSLQYFDVLNYDHISTILNVGVHSGFEIPFLALMARPDSVIHSFDPLGAAYLSEYVKAFADADPHRNAIHEIGIGENIGSMKLMLSNHQCLPFSNAGAIREENPVIDCKATTIDQFATDACLDGVDLIKLDIEGGEPSALRGAMQTIRRHRPQLAISIYHFVNHYVEIPLFLIEQLPDYRFFVRRYAPTNCEVVFYAVPKEIPLDKR